jgi:uncharacterized protein YhbP (UPF0306 family)
VKESSESFSLMARHMTLEAMVKVVTAYMDSLTTMTVACCMDGRPWTASVYYARIGLNLVFFSSPNSLHIRAFADNPLASACIHGYYDKWQEIKGLQIEGRVELVSGAQTKAEALSVYFRKYPFARQLLSDPWTMSKELVKKASTVEMYVFRSSSIFYLDNKEDFGKRWKLAVKDGVGIGDPVKI